MNYLTAWDELYQRRGQRLEASDWTQAADSPLSDEKKAEWRVYRQALRDMPQAFPADVDKANTNPWDTVAFPTKPESD